MFDRRGRRGLFMMLLMIVFAHGIHLVKPESGAREISSSACSILKSHHLKDGPAFITTTIPAE